jgi:hypothetical protein
MHSFPSVVTEVFIAMMERDRVGDRDREAAPEPDPRDLGPLLSSNPNQRGQRSPRIDHQQRPTTNRSRRSPFGLRKE